MSSLRGRIHTPHLAAQLRDFSGLRYGTITPTDIDAVLDFGNRLFVFIEAKLTGADMPRGQRLALERLTDRHPQNRQQAIGIVCEHANRDGVIDLARCVVTEYRWQGAWRAPERRLTVRQAVDAILLVCRLTHYLET